MPCARQRQAVVRCPWSALCAPPFPLCSVLVVRCLACRVVTSVKVDCLLSILTAVPSSFVIRHSCADLRGSDQSVQPSCETQCHPLSRRFYVSTHQRRSRSSPGFKVTNCDLKAGAERPTSDFCRPWLAVISEGGCASASTIQRFIASTS